METGDISVYDFARGIMNNLANMWMRTEGAGDPAALLPPTMMCHKWSNAFLHNEAGKVIEQVRKETSPALWKCVMALSCERKFHLGFRFLDGKSAKQDKMLVPLWIYAILPDNFECGGKKKSDVDNQTKFGCVFWLV